ncbi:MAG: F0F1 ATP synthase subunit B [Mycobacterium sp.]|nr:F0F1 ATP synthase subunit B [Mycobacterium sp.]
MAEMNATVLAAGRAVAEGGGSNFLVPNGTFFFVLAIFLIVLGVIGTFVVPPIMKVLREREYMVAKTQADNKRSDEQFAAARDDYEKTMAEARSEASGLRDGARAEGRKVLDDMRRRTEDEVNSTLQDAREQLKQEGDSIAEELRSRVDTMSTTLASRILRVDIATSSAATGSKR